VIMGEIPTGEKFDPNRVDPDRVDPDAVRPKTERKFTKEEQQEFNRQQKQREQSEQDKQEKEQRDKFLEKELTELDPETLKKLKEEGITPVEDPVDPYAETKGEWVRFDNVPIDASGKVWGDVGFDPNNITDYRNEPVRRPEGMSDAEIQADFERIKAEQPKDEPKDEPDPTKPTGLQDFRSDYQKKLGLTAGNQWVNESDSSTWPAIEATQRQQWNEKTQQFDLKYNRNLPQSNIPDHPQYYENNPEHPLNLKPDVNVEWTPAGSKEEIFNWTGQAGLPTYTTIADWQWTGDEYENVNREVMLESESYKKNDGTWEYKYRYVDRRTGEVVEGWKYWNPGG